MMVYECSLLGDGRFGIDFDLGLARVRAHPVLSVLEMLNQSCMKAVKVLVKSVEDQDCASEVGSKVEPVKSSSSDVPADKFSGIGFASQPNPVSQVNCPPSAAPTAGAYCPFSDASPFSNTYLYDYLLKQGLFEVARLFVTNGADLELAEGPKARISVAANPILNIHKRCQSDGSLDFSSSSPTLAHSHSNDYLVTGTWSQKAADEAKRLGCSVNILTDSRQYSHDLKTFDSIPDQSTWKFGDHNLAFIYYCDNETVNGVEFTDEGILGGSGLPKNYEDVLIVVDMSSNILTRCIPTRLWDRVGVIFGGAQKNMGPSGLTVVVVRKDLMEVMEVVHLSYCLMMGGDAQDGNQNVHTWLLGLVLLEYSCLCYGAFDPSLGEGLIRRCW
ncbi:pyridoxal phosphate-dependent transferase [Phakopsora pachyrhizi]|uniref:Pyridoxal phosphate-dependent transferase n=1 Tax=Phakopsora pachyrhizi TaxID=170000 RepID=A0AAV0AR99_PHAPC|nr:pyridoxal phosphate-dependent transferase [Phakopsora pachyrhizi]